MNFSEKMVFLMNLTSTSNKQLAEAVMVDPSLISLLRTARREPPKNNTYVKSMSSYFAKKCEGNYQRIALSEVMGRKHLQMQMDVSQLTSVLFDWLTDEREQVGQFLNTFEEISVENADSINEKELTSMSSKEDSNGFAYYGNQGKRGAVEAFVTYLLGLEESGTILLLIDEDLTWLLEDSAYLNRLEEQVRLLLSRGFKICRIASPLKTADQAFDSLSKWLPLYLTTRVESFFYPRLRDDLYRRTLIVLPNVAAVVSTSVGGQVGSRSTIFTKDSKLASSFAGEFNDILSKCQPMMKTHSTEKMDDLLRCLSQFESDRGNRIQQSISLSSITCPPEIIRQIAATSINSDGDMILESLSDSHDIFRQNLWDYKTIDIQCLATVEELCSGCVPIAPSYLMSKGPFFYTPDTYAFHLNIILSYMEQYENYTAIFKPRSPDTHSLMVKEGQQALLLRPKSPLVLFEVKQRDIIEACHEYLMRSSESHLTAQVQRQETMSIIKQMIKALQ